MELFIPEDDAVVAVAAVVVVVIVVVVVVDVVLIATELADVVHATEPDLVSCTISFSSRFP